MGPKSPAPAVRLDRLGRNAIAVIVLFPAVLPNGEPSNVIRIRGRISRDDRYA